MDTRGAMAEDEGEVETRDDEITYTTLGGTRVVSNTRFLMARKLDLRLNNQRQGTFMLSTHKLFWFTYHWAPQPLGIYGSASEKPVSH